MRVIITGGTGFLGRHLVWHLATQDCDVSFTGRNLQAAKSIIAAASKHVQFFPLAHETDIAESTLTTLAKSADAIVHCAALSSPWGTPDSFHQANVESTQQVVRACLVNNTPRLIHISTPSIYFAYADRINIRESDPLPTPVNTYAATKREAENIVTESGIPQSVILRPRAIFGPWDNTLMPRLLRVIERGMLPIPNKGEALLDLTYVDNVVHAIWLALTQTLPNACSTYNVSNGEPIQFNQLLERLRQELQLPIRTLQTPYRLLDYVARCAEIYARLTHQREPFLTRYSAGTLAFSQTLNLDAIRSDLNYSPIVSIDAGIQRYAKWLKHEGSRHGAT